MPDLYLDPTTGDIWFSPTGQTRLTADLGEEVRQRLDTKYRFFLGEWFLDARLGVPYFRDVLVKNPDMRVVRSLMERVAITDPGVDAVTQLDVTLDTQTRVLTVAFECVLIDGSVLNLEVRDFSV
jgi:hypothetical protein